METMAGLYLTMAGIYLTMAGLYFGISSKKDFKGINAASLGFQIPSLFINNMQITFSFENLGRFLIK